MYRWLIAGVIVLVAGYFLMPFFGFDQDNADGQERTQFAADRAGDDVKAPFDGQRAMDYLKKICDIGPRMSDTAGMRKQQELIRKHFEKIGHEIQEQTFTARQVSQNRGIEMKNLIVWFHPKKERRIILCSHYDTRPIADQEKDPKGKWREPFVSANDGGSGVAFLMELGHHVKDLKLAVGLDFVIFDGEEYIFDGDRDKYFFGSEHFASTWKKNKKQPNYIAAVLLDMIAGKNAQFPFEGHSIYRARPLCLSIWGTARDLGCKSFQDRQGAHVRDDHLALQNVGIPAIDIIDFDYPHWHRLSDTPENCAAEPMIEVAKVLSTWMQRIK